MLCVRKQGVNNHTKDFNVRRADVQQALLWLKNNNEAYSDIMIKEERLRPLPENGEINIDTIYGSNTSYENDCGSAQDQVNTDDISGITSLTVPLPEQSLDLKQQMQSTLKNIAVQGNSSKTVVIPWPSQNDTPMSEFTTEHFFTFFIPVFFHKEQGTFTLPVINRARTCSGASMSDWSPHVVQGWKICPTTEIFQIYCTQYNYEKKNFRTEHIHHEKANR